MHNLPKQREFRKQDYRLVAEPYAARLRALQEPGATTRLATCDEAAAATRRMPARRTLAAPRRQPIAKELP